MSGYSAGNPPQRHIPTRALKLGNVCRAGFAGRGTPSVAVHRAAFSLSVPDPRRSLGSGS